jgi:hypothetical protein
MTQDQVWVELVGQIIIARVRGPLTVDAMQERHARVVQLVQDTGCRSVLFDVLEANAPTFDATQVQRKLNLELRALDLRLAVVVPNSRLAYVGRMVFGEENHRIVYNDMAEAVLWLRGEESAGA